MRTETLTTLTRKASDLLAELKRDRAPVLITRHGLPGAWLLDVASYERLQSRLAVLEGVVCGEAVVAEGRVVSHVRARRRLAGKKRLAGSGPRKR